MKETQNKRLKVLAIIAAIFIAIVAAQFGYSKYVLNRDNEAELNFYEYRIAQSEIVISPEEYTGSEVTVTITTQKPGLSIQYQLGDEGQWFDYTGPFTVDDNIKVNARLVADEFTGPVTDKQIDNIAVAKIGDTTYKTLEEAIEACPENAGSIQTTIELLTNVKESVVIPEGKNVILDLCGNNVTSDTTTITVEGKFNLIDSKNQGTVSSTSSDSNNAAIKVGSTGNFTLGTNESEPEVNEKNPTISG